MCPDKVRLELCSRKQEGTISVHMGGWGLAVQEICPTSPAVTDTLDHPTRHHSVQLLASDTAHTMRLGPLMPILAPTLVRRPI